MSNLIDSHVNFGHELLKNSVSDICKDALENNIERILSINSNIYEFQKDINLIKGFNFVDITLGHHPNNTLDIKPEEIKTLLNENIKLDIFDNFKEVINLKFLKIRQPEPLFTKIE